MRAGAEQMTATTAAAAKQMRAAAKQMRAGAEQMTATAAAAA